MLTKKCTTSFAAFALDLFLMFAATLLMQFCSVSKWVGVSVGSGMMLVMLVLRIVLRKRNFIPYLTLPVNAVASGIAASSLFVYLKTFPALWQAAVLFAALCLLFYVYCLLTWIPFFRKHYKICMFVYILLAVAGSIIGFVFCTTAVFAFAMLCMIPFIAFLVTTVLDCSSRKEHMKSISFATFAALLFVIIVVLIVISGGDGLDGLSGGDGLGLGDQYVQKNPYEYYTI